MVADDTEILESVVQLQELAQSQAVELADARDLIGAMRRGLDGMEHRFLKFAERAEQIDTRQAKEAKALAAKIAVVERTFSGLVNQTELGILARITELAATERKTRKVELSAEAKSIRAEVESLFRPIKKALDDCTKEIGAADTRAKGFAKDAADAAAARTELTGKLL